MYPKLINGGQGDHGEQGTKSMSQLDLEVLKAQNQGLVARVHSLQARLAQLDGSEERRTETLVNCVLLVDSFTGKMKMVANSNAAVPVSEGRKRICIVIDTRSGTDAD